MLIHTTSPPSQPTLPPMTTPTALLTSPPPNPKIHLTTVSDNPKNLEGLKRLNSLLLPVNYGTKFYQDIIRNPDTDGALTRVAMWDGGVGVVGGVRGRWEPPSSSSSSSLSSSSPTDGTPRGGKIYLMTLCTLSPFRTLGIAAALLQHIVAVAREWGVEEVYAHVWVENGEALEWYRRRGFVVEEGVVEGYYRRLRPDGARVVRLRMLGE
ncbi:hypothetical protein EX30DRAFT_155669 [Ascodesmis nigricans]|uniref:N-acetyltransferase domain-containing protein n=1 Tax=Ascodesmis nigricans TaxID=341454 RepID=A0A4S2N2U5_9PEZI|nr:hypothetical protein EX30DRAFT_155669 [Ascodesmis nigricans]